MLIKYIKNFRWNGIEQKPYKTEDGSFLNVKRFEIVKGNDNEFRYFEISKGGYSSIEKHEHEHIVVFVKGKGYVLIDDKIFEVEPFDVIYIPSWTVHRFIAKDEDIGFFCIVKKDRDKPQKLNDDEIRELLQRNPDLRAFIYNKL